MEGEEEEDNRLKHFADQIGQKTEIFIRRRSNIDAIRKLQQSRAAVPMLMKSRYVSKQIPRRPAAGTVIFKCT